MADRREAFPSAPQAACLLLAHFLLQYLIGALLYDLRDPLGLTLAQLSALVTLLATGLLLAPVMQLQRMTYRELLHPSPSSWVGTVVLLVPPVLLTVPLIILLDDGLMAVLHRIFPMSAWEQQAFSQMMAPELPAIVAVCVLAPVLEEMLFRGVLLRGFLARYPRGVAIAYSSLFFGAAHLNVYQFFLAFWLGLILGWLFERSRSLIPCIALHGATNAAVLVLSTVAEKDGQSVLDTLPASVWLAAIVAAALGTWLLRRLLARAPGSSS